MRFTHLLIAVTFFVQGELLERYLYVHERRVQQLAMLAADVSVLISF